MTRAVNEVGGLANMHEDFGGPGSVTATVNLLILTKISRDFAVVSATSNDCSFYSSLKKYFRFLALIAMKTLDRRPQFGSFEAEQSGRFSKGTLLGMLE